MIALLAILCGLFGRMGGSGRPYKTWVRDWICPLITLLAVWLIIGFNPRYWWAYLLTYGLTGASLTTYYDTIFRGEDNLWFAGWMSGLAFLPLIWTGVHLYAILPRAFLLAVIWGSLNKYLPSKILIWRRDIAEEFLRYSALVLTLPILLI